MNRILSILPLVLLLGCRAPTEASFFVAGSCEECAKLIEETLESVSGVEYVSWSEHSSSLTVHFDGTEAQMETIQMALSSAGFDTQFFPANAEKKAELPACCQQSKPSLSIPEGDEFSPH